MSILSAIGGSNVKRQYQQTWPGNSIGWARETRSLFEHWYWELLYVTSNTKLWASLYAIVLLTMINARWLVVCKLATDTQIFTPAPWHSIGKWVQMTILYTLEVIPHILGVVFPQLLCIILCVLKCFILLQMLFEKTHWHPGPVTPDIETIIKTWLKYAGDRDGEGKSRNKDQLNNGLMDYQ